MAPAGTWEALEAAVFAGADAVYLGGSALVPGLMPKILAPEELQRAITFAHLHHVRIYVTVNTLVTDEEMKALGEVCSRSSAMIGVVWHYCPGSWHHPALPPHGT